MNSKLMCYIFNFKNKMKILVIHNSLNACGGGERVALHTIDKLQSENFDVSVGVVEKTDWEKVFNVVGIRLKRTPKEYYLVRELKLFGIYQRILQSYQVLKLRRKFDLIINTHGDVLLLSADVTYMHFPTLLMILDNWAKYTKYGKSVFWRVYFEPYRILQNFLRDSLENSLLLTNSRFSQGVISKYLNRNALVVYPPVEIHDYYIGEKEDVVISIGRFSREKNWHLLPEIAQKISDIKFVLIGSVSNKVSERYYNEILKIKEKLRADNLEIIPNASYHMKVELLAKAKVLLHLYPYEHFGIVGVEAQASGVLPITHKSGGLWLDVCKEGEYGLGYSKLDVDEIVSVIEKGLNVWSHDFAVKLREHSEKFSDRRFKERMFKVIMEYANFNFSS